MAEHFAFQAALGFAVSHILIRRGLVKSNAIRGSSPMFAPTFAVLLVGDVWTFQNFLGTSLVILGVVILSRVQTEQAHWRFNVFKTCDMVQRLS